MAFHKKFMASEGRTTFDIQTNVSKLMFRVIFDCSGPAAQDYGENKMRVIANSFRNVINGKITVTRHSSKLGPKVLIQNMPLNDLAEIASNNEGYIHINYKGNSTYGGVSVAARYEATFTVELSNEGSIQTDKADFLKIDLDGFALGADGYSLSGMEVEYNIYSLGSYVTRNEHIKYSPVACQGGAQTSVDCTSHYSLALPVGVRKVSLTSTTGELLEILQEELEIISCDVSDIVYLIEGKTLGFLAWRTFPIPLAHKANIELVANGLCYLIGNKNYEG